MVKKSMSLAGVDAFGGNGERYSQGHISNDIYASMLVSSNVSSLRGRLREGPSSRLGHQ